MNPTTYAEPSQPVKGLAVLEPPETNIVWKNPNVITGGKAFAFSFTFLLVIFTLFTSPGAVLCLGIAAILIIIISA